MKKFTDKRIYLYFLRVNPVYIYLRQKSLMENILFANPFEFPNESRNGIARCCFYIFCVKKIFNHMSDNEIYAKSQWRVFIFELIEFIPDIVPLSIRCILINLRSFLQLARRERLKSILSEDS